MTGKAQSPVTGRREPSDWEGAKPGDRKGAKPVTGKARSPLRMTGAWAETSGTSETSGSVPGVVLRTRNRLAGFAQANGMVR